VPSSASSFSRIPLQRAPGTIVVLEDTSVSFQASVDGEKLPQTSEASQAGNIFRRIYILSVRPPYVREWYRLFTVLHDRFLRNSRPRAHSVQSISRWRIEILERLILRPLFFACALSVTIALWGCAPTEEAERRAAQEAAEQYLDHIKNNDFSAAYRNTFSQVHKNSLDEATFVRYRSSVTRLTGPLRGYRLVELRRRPGMAMFDSVFMLDGERGLAQEKIELTDENGVWKVSSLDIVTPKPADQGQPGGAPTGPGA
jgi:hypothetical protein